MQTISRLALVALLTSSLPATAAPRRESGGFGRWAGSSSATIVPGSVLSTFSATPSTETATPITTSLVADQALEIRSSSSGSKSATAVTSVNSAYVSTATGTKASTNPTTSNTAAASSSTTGSADGPMVFVHYMVVAYPVNGDYAGDIASAAQAGADAMALNFGGWGDSFTVWEQWLDEIYTAAEATTMKLFISFDMTSVSDPTMITTLALKYVDSPAQLYWKDKMVISSFSNNDTYTFSWQTDVLDVINAKLSNPALFLPGSTNPQPSTLYGSAYPEADGIFYWPSYSADVSLQESFDTAFFKESASTEKLLMIGISPWFSKHLSDDMNWGNNQGSSLFVDRFQRMLTLKPDFIEIVALNDYGECDNLIPQPPSADAYYYANLDHTGFLEMAAIFSAAFKAGDEDVTITDDRAYVLYRTQPWATPGSQDSIGVPTDSTEDDVLSVFTFLTAAADVSVVNGDKTNTFTAPAGYNKQEYAFTTGNVTMTVTRDSTQLVKKEGPAITDDPTLWNGNAVCI